MEGFVECVGGVFLVLQQQEFAQQAVELAQQLVYLAGRYRLSGEDVRRERCFVGLAAAGSAQCPIQAQQPLCLCAPVEVGRLQKQLQISPFRLSQAAQ